MFLIEKKLFLSTQTKFNSHGFGQKMPILSLFGFGQNKDYK